MGDENPVIDTIPPSSSSSSSSSSSHVITETTPAAKIAAEPAPSASGFYNYFTDDEKGVDYDKQLPILYSDRYNISFMGIEKLHPFDSCKYRNIVAALLKSHTIKKNELVAVSKKPSREMLLLVHTTEYLDSLLKSITVARITELVVCAALPNFLNRWRVLDPMLYATSGSILAAKLAIEKGWSINLSGGYHHACGYDGGGFCVYADITLSYAHMRQHYPTMNSVMIIDLDAHQGNGHERDKLNNDDTAVYILDIFNSQIYPQDHAAERAIDLPVKIRCGTGDAEYLNLLETNLDIAIRNRTPDVIYYNAGTDILAGDPLGQLDITPQGVITRDEMVFRFARRHNIPIVMMLSGGYQKTNAGVIAESISNLFEKLDLRNTHFAMH